MNELTIATVTHDLEALAPQFARMLPPHIPLDRFQATIMAQVEANPNALKADYTSLKRAWTEAAEDGILPDGRKGFINVYNEKFKFKRNNAWIEEYRLVAKWTPMALGITERANDHGILIDAQAYYANDKITPVLGTHPRLEHSFDMMKSRGALVGAYAVFKRLDTQEVLRVEVIGAEDMAKIRACSKQPNGLLWGTFTDQAYCKSAIRRGAKFVRSLPPSLLRTIERNDSDYDFDRPALPAPKASAPAGSRWVPPSSQQQIAAAAQAQAPKQNVTEAEVVEPERKLTAEETFLEVLGQRLGAAKTLRAAQAVWEKNANTIEYKLPTDAKHQAYELWNVHEARLAKTVEAAE